MVETLGTWHDAESLKRAWRELPNAAATPGDIGADLVAGSIAKCVEHLTGEGLDVPADDAVTALHRMAQVYFARSLWAILQTNAGTEQVGTPGFQVPAYQFARQARDTLGYGVVFG